MKFFGANRVVVMPGFSPALTIQGQMYHKIRYLLPISNMQPNFLHMGVMFMGDKEAEIERRARLIQGVDR